MIEPSSHAPGHDVKAVVLAAGPGRRLGPLTRELPKTLLPLGEGGTILDLVLANLASVGVGEVAVVTGFAAGRVDELVPELEDRHGLSLRPIFNERAKDWNNAHSLWLARDAFADGALLVNGDTVHPASVEESLQAEFMEGVRQGVNGTPTFYIDGKRFDGDWRDIDQFAAAIDAAAASSTPVALG